MIQVCSTDSSRHRTDRKAIPLCSLIYRSAPVLDLLLCAGARQRQAIIPAAVVVECATARVHDDKAHLEGVLLGAGASQQDQRPPWDERSCRLGVQCQQRADRLYRPHACHSGRGLVVNRLPPPIPVLSYPINVSHNDLYSLKVVPRSHCSSQAHLVKRQLRRPPVRTGQVDALRALHIQRAQGLPVVHPQPQLRHSILRQWAGRGAVVQNPSATHRNTPLYMQGRPFTILHARSSGFHRLQGRDNGGTPHTTAKLLCFATAGCCYQMKQRKGPSPFDWSPTLQARPVRWLCDKCREVFAGCISAPQQCVSATAQCCVLPATGVPVSWRSPPREQ